jgi:hypothetical protein
MILDACLVTFIFEEKSKLSFLQVNKLDETESPATERLGRIYIHHVRETEVHDSEDNTKNHSDEHKTVNCSLVGQVECPAVLDMKWNRTCLGVVTAAGGLQIYAYSDEADRPLTLKYEKGVTSGLALALGGFLEKII